MNLQIEMYASDAKQDILSLTTLLDIVVYLKKSCTMSVCLSVCLSFCLSVVYWRGETMLFYFSNIFPWINKDISWVKIKLANFDNSNSIDLLVESLQTLNE